MDSVKRWIVAVGAVGVAMTAPVISFAEDAESRFGSMFGASDSISFVGGVSGGMNYFGGKHTMTATEGLTHADLEEAVNTGNRDLYLILPAKRDAGRIQPLYGAFLGVHMRLDEKMFAGFEISGDFSKHNINFEVHEHLGEGYDTYAYAKLKRDEMYAATFLFGVKLSEGADVYIRAGGVMTKVREELYVETPQAGGGFVPTTFKGKRAKNVDGFLLGVGLRGHINENIALRLEYNYVGLTLPKKMHLRLGTADSTGGAGEPDDYMYLMGKAKLSNQSVLASVEFAF